MPSGTVIAGWTSAPVPVARRRLPSRCRPPSRVSAWRPSDELDPDEALALDGDVERVARLAQDALLEAAAGLDGARAVADA